MHETTTLFTPSVPPRATWSLEHADACRRSPARRPLRPERWLLRSLASGLLGAAVSLVSAVASADDTATAEAQRRFQEGVPLMDAGKFEEARLKFLQAVAVLKAPPLYYNLASTEQQTGHDVDAVRHYRFFLRAAANDTRITDKQREKAKQNIASLLEKLGQIAVNVPPGTALVVDGVPYDGDPTEPIPVTPGAHRVEATLDGRVRSQTVEARAGAITRLELPAESKGAEETPPADRRATMRIVVPVGLAVLGLASAGVGAGFLVDANAKDKAAVDFNREFPGGACGPQGNETVCQSYRAKLSNASTSQTVAIVGFVGGGALAAGALAAFLLWPRSSAESSPRQRTPPSTAALRVRVAPLLGTIMGVQGSF